MKLGRLISALGMVAAVAAAMLSGGCENDHSVDGSEFYLSPASYTFVREKDHVVSFGVHGAVLPVTWTLSDTGMGNLSGVTPDTKVDVTVANYTRGEQAGINTLMVTDARGWRASARITVPARLVDAAGTGTNGAASATGSD